MEENLYCNEKVRSKRKNQWMLCPVGINIYCLGTTNITHYTYTNRGLNSAVHQSTRSYFVFKAYEFWPDANSSLNAVSALKAELGPADPLGDPLHPFGCCSRSGAPGASVAMRGSAAGREIGNCIGRYRLYIVKPSLISPINRVVADTTHVAAQSRCTGILLSRFSP